jgi:hypothetical protein
MKLSCTNCNQSLEIPDELLGQSIECPVCKIKFTAGQSSTNSVYDVKPLIALCEKILHDEEVSVEELYELAEFLNANPEAGKHWPGNQFIAPLQEVWADGVIDSLELARMEHLIIETRREWRRRVAPMKKTEAPAGADLTSGFAASTDSGDIARINGPDIRLEVPSASYPGSNHRVDLKTLTCDCSDWKFRRRTLPEGHFSRCCEHILYAFEHLGAENLPSMLRAFLKNTKPPDPEKNWIIRDVGYGNILISDAPHGWSDVFARGRDGWGMFGCNFRQKRWKYGSEPEGAAAIMPLIKEEFPE